jgi:hypothetical protein
MTIARVANFQINLESLDLAKAAIEEFISAVRDNELGTLIYLSIQSRVHPAF